MRGRTRLSLLVTVCLSFQPAWAETALEVQSWCKRTSEALVLANGSINLGASFNDGFCWGAFAAIQDFSRHVNSEKQRLLNICTPPGSTRLVLIKVFMRYADQHPQALVGDFAFVVQAALGEAFPCGAADGYRR